MKKLWFILSLVVFLFGVSACEKSPVETRDGKGGDGVLGGEENSLVGEWYVYDSNNKLVGEATFTETTIYTKYDYANTTTIMDSRYEIYEEVLGEYTYLYLKIPENYMDTPENNDYVLHCRIIFNSKDSVDVGNFLYIPNYIVDVMPPAVGAVLVRKGGAGNE